MCPVRRTCPICGCSFDGVPGAADFPFCSTRCKLVDLGNWLDERYRIPVGRGGTAFADERDGTDDPGPKAE
jgi:endogenous inhibitor of DNA gyrase (YacG/DUF329 family)